MFGEPIRFAVVSVLPGCLVILPGTITIATLPAFSAGPPNRRLGGEK
jgi:hypothetical protein